MLRLGHLFEPAVLATFLLARRKVAPKTRFFSSRMRCGYNDHLQVLVFGLVERQSDEAEKSYSAIDGSDYI